MSYSRFVIAAALVLGTAVVTHAQVQSDPNQIQGTFRFSNVDPEARAILAGYPVISGWVDSSHPTLGTATTELLPAPDGSGSFELSVQATPEGVSHELVAWYIQLQADGRADRWETAPVMSPPVFPEPAPDVEMAIEECAALIRLRAYDETGARIAWPGGRAIARHGDDDSSSSINPGLLDDYMVLPLRPEAWRVSVSVSGYVPVGATIGPVGCDQIETFDVTLEPSTPPDPTECAVTGLFDVLGEVEGVLSDSGDVRTYLVTDRSGRHEFTEAPAEGVYDLTGVGVGTRRVTARTSLRSYNRFQKLYVSPASFNCPDATTVDLGDTFAMRPGLIVGDLFVAGPPPTRDSTAGLAHFRRVDSGPNGADYCALSRLDVSNINPGGNVSQTCSLFEGDFEPRSAALEGDFEIVTAVAENLPRDFTRPRLTLSLDRRPPDGPRLNHHVSVYPHAPFLPITPGDIAETGVRLCYSEVAIGFEALAGEFEQAEVRADGGLQGPDFEGTVVDYDAYAITRPDAGEPPVTSATVHVLLPEGTYTITPRVILHDPGGGMTRTTLPEFSITVGCRENLRLFDTLQLHVTTPPPVCADGDVNVLGAVSGGADVARLAWRVNGGTESVVCAPCGVDPEFDITVPTVSGDNEIRFEATDALSRTAHSIVMTRRATEPAAGALAPLLVGRDMSGGVHLTWGGAPVDLFTVHRGTIASLSAARTHDHARVSACDLPSFEFAESVPAEDAYYLVTAGCGLAHGSYGRDTFGAERPLSANDCP